MSEGIKARDSTYRRRADQSTRALDPLPQPALVGRVCLVTGANRGIGKATAAALARLGATVVMLVRDRRSAVAVRDEIERQTANPAISVVPLDLASFASVRAAAAEIGDRYSAVHVLINNAGVAVAKRASSTDGIELTLAVNHVGPFLLTNLLLPLLRTGALLTGDARVVTVSSGFERFGRIAFNDLQQTRRYMGLLAYTQSKLANVLFTYELAARLRDTGVTANCVYPGLVATDLLRDRLWWSPRLLRPLWRRLLLTPEEGARSSVYVAAAPELAGMTGKCFDAHAKQVRSSRRSYDVELRKRLWRASEELTGLLPDERRWRERDND